MIGAQARLAVSVVALLAAAAAALPVSAVADPLGETVSATAQVTGSIAPADLPARPAAPGASAPQLAVPAAAAAVDSLRNRVAEPVHTVRPHRPVSSPRKAFVPAVLDRPATGVTILSSPARAFGAQRAGRRTVARGFAHAGKSGGGTVAAPPAASISQTAVGAPTARPSSAESHSAGATAPDDDRSPGLLGASNASTVYAAYAGGLMAALVFLVLAIPGCIRTCGGWMPSPRPRGFVSALELPG